MKRILSWLIAIAMLAAAACVPALADEEDTVWGTYTMSSMSDEESGEDMTEMLEMMASLGMAATLTINEDGAAQLDLFGETEEMTFDFDAMTVYVDEDTQVSYTYEDGVLSFGDQDVTMTFTKGEPELPKTNRPFDYYVLVAETDGDGADLEPDEDADLVLYAEGDGILTYYGEEMDVNLDFDAMTFDLMGQTGEFTREEDALTLVAPDGYALQFRLADPGYVGDYTVTGMSSEEDGEMDEDLDMLRAIGLAPTLTINEDGSGSMSMFGVSIEMNFDFDAMTVTSVTEEGEETQSFTYENGQISFESEGSSMTFSRVLELEENSSLMDLFGGLVDAVEEPAE